HSGTEGSLHGLREYAKCFPAIEFSFPLTQLPDLSFVHSVESVHTLRPVWRVTVCDLEEEKIYFEREPWFHFVRALRSNSTTNALILSFERASEYDEKQMDLLLEVREALFPLT